MLRRLIILLLIVGCVLLAPYPEETPGDYEIGMSIEEFKHKNPLTPKYIHPKVSNNGDTLMYRRIEDWSKTFEKSHWHRIEYLFVDGKLYAVRDRKNMKGGEERAIRPPHRPERDKDHRPERDKEKKRKKEYNKG